MEANQMSDGTERTGEGLVGFVRQVAFAGLGAAFAAAAGSHLVFRALAEEGEKIARRERPEVERTLVAVSDRVQDLRERVGVAVEESLTAGLSRFGVPSREEVRRLALRIEQLTVKLEAFGLER